MNHDLAFHARAEKNIRRALPFAPDVETMQVLVDRLRQHTDRAAQLRRIHGVALQAKLIGGAVKADAKKAQARK